MASTSWSLLMLLLVLALIPLVLWTLKRIQTFQPPGTGPRPLELTAQIALGARERVVMVRVQDRLLVLGVTPQQVTLLGEADPAAVPPPAPAPDFAGLLRGLAKGRGG
ncbi:MAG TPA: flagellar biosynthetic protein FliO [Ramlibacter sp.]|jgi:flagellar protein FliO/FliZ|uniref:flagellar biosynthetic protein FliO n=1 Tax=Ramlibacter sp. TaxID=1917967 RepID=UPI002D3201BF|nr:flagellar biosynthetic protein FliO [Ramlibacter sp.]HZY19164.1 flagellar biosynthetic protein FliO [Ramlibacter sp.]